MPDNSDATVKDYIQKDELTLEDVEELRKLVYGSEKNRDAVKKYLAKTEGDASIKRSASKSYKRALACWFADRDDEAIELLGKNLKSPQSYRTYIGWCLTKERFTLAYDAACSAAKKFKSDIGISLLLGQAAAKCGELAEAEKAVKQVKKALPKLDLEALRDRAQELTAFEDAAQDDAAEPGEQPSEPERYPQHSDLLYLQGLIEEAKGNWEETVGFYDDAILADRQNILAYFRKAYSLDLRGMDEEAMETYEKARRLRPLHVNVLFNLGVLYEDTGKNRKAIQCYKTILEDNPSHARAKLFLHDAESSRSMVYDEEEEKEQDKLLQVLNTPITDFELSVRSRNCLAKMNIRTLGDLSRKTELELLSYKNFGETSLAEIKTLLSSKNLSLGMGTDEFFRTEEEEEPIEELLEVEDERPDLLDTPLNSMNFSVRCRRAFEKLGLRTLGELAETKEAEFQGLRNFGQTSLIELKGKLAEYGLALQTS